MSSTSQLGWHLEEPPSYDVKVDENFIKKGEKRYTRGDYAKTLITKNKK